MARRRRRHDDRGIVSEALAALADQSLRLRLATRIHFALLRRYDENVEVSTLLKGGSDAQEALWVCEASGDPALRNLAAQFRAACEAQQAAALPRSGRTPQDTPWARNTSGFGLGQPLPEDLPPLAEPGWKHPLRWLRGGR